VSARSTGSGSAGRRTKLVANVPAMEPAVAAALTSPARRPTLDRLSVSA
jgi:hypothetical protein